MTRTELNWLKRRGYMQAIKDEIKQRGYKIQANIDEATKNNFKRFTVEINKIAPLIKDMRSLHNQLTKLEKL